ncbi:MAG: carbon storage regulator [Candidatus Nealsonbacteria bacterium]|nr:carbon storage regulator [Candidatus Nealsonbacteria bacterium]
MLVLIAEVGEKRLEIVITHPLSTQKSSLMFQHEDIAHANGREWSYYLSGQDGTLMLVLHRQIGERIRVGDGTEIVILDIHDGKVTIGIRCQRPGTSSGDGAMHLPATGLS